VHSTDKLTIDTPEQVALELPLAGIGSRFLALTFDSLLQFVAVVAVFVVLALSELFVTTLQPIAHTVGPVVVTLFLFCLYWGYFAFFEIIWNGQTPGKRHAGIRVIKETGRPVTAIEAIGRNLLRAIDILPGVYGVGLICMICNRQNRRLGDFVAGTVVVHDKTVDSVSPGWTSERQAATTGLQSAKITADELVLIETYLDRRYDLDPSMRLGSARKIVTMVQSKTGIEKVPQQSDDDFLEEVAREVRDAARFR
jgi:uncharacterized RDD family membrane protein YckC